MSDLDDLLQPSVGQSPREPREKPYRVQSQFWVAFFGGILPVTAVALLNAQRLGIDKRKRWLMGAAALIALVVVFVLLMQQPPFTDLAGFARSSREVRLFSRITSVALFLVLAALQKPADAHYQVFSGGDYASLWKVGIATTLILGTAQNAVMGVLLWLIRQ